MNDATIIRHDMPYVMDNFRNSEDNVLLHGIDLEFIDGFWCPVIPHCGPLTDLAVLHPECHEFRWSPFTKKWVTVND
jgi:hypothetical protein